MMLVIYYFYCANVLADMCVSSHDSASLRTSHFELGLPEASLLPLLIRLRIY